MHGICTRESRKKSINPPKKQLGMNKLQLILDILLKVEKIGLFDDAFKAEEQDLINKFKKSVHLKTLRVEDMGHKEYALKWKSSIEEVVGCPVAKNQILFGEAGAYSKRTGCFKGTIEACYPGDADTADRFQQEIEELKKILLSYSQDVEQYFR